MVTGFFFLILLIVCTGPPIIIIIIIYLIITAQGITYAPLYKNMHGNKGNSIHAVGTKNIISVLLEVHQNFGIQSVKHSAAMSTS